MRGQSAADVFYPLVDAFAVPIGNRPDFVANATVLDATRGLLHQHAAATSGQRDEHWL